MTNIRFNQRMSVDAGMIGFIKRSFLEKYGPLRESGAYSFLTVPKGVQEIVVTVNDCHNGTVVGGLKNIFTEDTEFVVGDPCYAVCYEDRGWERFLEDTKYGDAIPNSDGISLNTGGDGGFEVIVQIRSDNESTI